MANPYRILCVDCEHVNFKLVEIGVVEFDLRTLEVIQDFQVLVFDSKKYKLRDLHLPDWFVSLTGITNEEFHGSAIPREDAKNKIRNTFGKKKAWYAWGEDDRLLSKYFLGPFTNYGLVRSHFQNPGHNINIMKTLPDDIVTDLKAHRALEDAYALYHRMRLDLLAVRKKS